MINKGKQKHRELLSETSIQLNANVLEQEKIIFAFNSQLLSMVLVILIAGTVASVIISRSISRPVKKLRSATSEIACGNLNVRTGISSNDEVGELASAFDKMTEELQKTTISRQTLQTMLNSMPYGIILIGMDKKIQSANHAALEMMGYGSEEEIAGQICNKVLCPAQDGKCPVIDLEQKVDRSEKILLTKNGRRIPILKSVVPVKLEGREILLEAFVDISDSKRAEEIHIENQKLSYASRAKSQFLANMSHELRTPLNSIIGFSELIKMNASLDEKSTHQLDNVLTSGKFLLNIINDILDISKVESGRMELVIEKINVPSFIDEILILTTEKASKQKILLKNELDPSLLALEADNHRLKQIMFNLLSNAIKFSKPEGGTITITVKKEGDMAKFSVSDTGIGIRDEDIGKLFCAFEQLDSGITKQYGGAGLGLAISKKLVELHGGTIKAESRYGEGSTFTFTLPIEAKKMSE